MSCNYKCAGWIRRAHAIRVRDQFKCQDCRKAGWHVHHIIYGKAVWGAHYCGNCHLLNVTDEDLVTLCPKCHDRRHGRRVKPLLTRVVNRVVKVLRKRKRR